jgi:cytochrome P450
MIISMDPPDHAAYRALTEAQFRASTLDQMTSTVREIARGFINKLEATGGECDFARTVAFVYPLRVVTNLIGISQEDEPYLLRLTRQMVAGHDPEHSRTGIALSGADAAKQQIDAVEDFNNYFRTIIADRRAAPRDDLATQLAMATLDGKPIPELELLSYYIILATAGHDTTASATLGGLIELARNPAEFRKLKEDPSLVKRFVEEAIRWVAPSKITMRTVLKDVEMCGRNFRKGDLIGLAWGSANRDPESFEEPDVFRADRRPNMLLSFGAGPHICLGQHLARLEMRLLFEELLSRVDHVELNGPVASVASFQISGPKSAPIRFRMTSARQSA